MHEPTLFLVSGVMIQDEYQETIIGTPQGGNLSPLLSNIMLHELDKELANRDLRFVRYADDCLIFVKSDMAARRVMRSVSKFIEEK
ncbi:reverse transcriptase domain-containing protein, partial [Listeria booriae]|nr:group II intron reverse transcriptase/maturase [Listeria booriae]